MKCPEYTIIEAFERWGEPGRIYPKQVKRACPWCASWLQQLGKPQGPFDSVVECVNVMCPMFPSGGCYWEPWPDGWSEANKQRWVERAAAEGAA